LTNSKQFSPGMLAKFKDTIRGSFSTGSGASLVGNDAANIALANAQNEVKFDNSDANNWYAPGSPNARRAYKGIAEKVDGMLKDSEKEDLPALQKYIAKVAVEGVKVEKDGKVVNMIPSENDLLAAIRSTKEGWVFNSGRTWDVEKELKKALMRASKAGMFVDAAESEEFRNKQAVKKKLLGKD